MEVTKNNYNGCLVLPCASIVFFEYPQFAEQGLLVVVFCSAQGDLQNSFISRMGARGAMPRLLRLRPEDCARTGSRPFQKGKFTWITEAGHAERWIVASCGKCRI